MTAYRARVQAVQSPSDDRASAAAKAERQALHLAAKERWLLAEQALADARKASETKEGKEKDVATAAAKKQEAQVAALKKTFDQAEKNLALTDSKFSPLGPIYPKTSSGRRKALAEWIASKDNPLTARVAVNHIWLRHFDRALVDTVFDFGRNGKTPSHPELLDWLAVEFMESGWKMQHLHRLIVTSATYRQQSASTGEQDPDNRWYARAATRRMEAEVVRDSILASADALDRQIGGIVIENKEETTSKRRALYFSVFPEDGGALKFVQIFDAPGSMRLLPSHQQRHATAGACPCEQCPRDRTKPTAGTQADDAEGR